MSTCREIPEALKTVLPDRVYHFYARKEEYPYVIWAEENPGAILYGDDGIDELSLSGSIRYFTLFEYDQTVNAIQTALDKSDITNTLLTIEFDKDTHVITYLWEWSVTCGNGKIY